MRRFACFIFAAALTTTPLLAQTQSGKPASAGQDTTTAQQAGPRVIGKFTDTVHFPNDRAVVNATIIAQRIGKGSANAAFITTTDSTGSFTFENLAAGAYEFRVLHNGRWFVQRVSVETANAGGLRLPAEENRNRTLTLFTLLCLALYGLTILTVRWHHIAHSIHAMLYRRLDALDARLSTEVEESPESEKKVKYLRQKLDNVREDFAPGTRTRGSISEFLFWSRGRENAAWVALHEVETQLAAFLAPPEFVESYLRWTEAQLRVLATPPAIALANTIAADLQPPQPGTPTDPATREKSRKALLGRAISVIYDQRDTAFSTMMEWQNKASWLILAAVILIVFLTAVAGNAILFLAGAAGGFVGRVTRALKREDVPLDYGASWTTLFLSPLFGALAGWFGIAIIDLATSSRVQLLGNVFDVVNWYEPYTPAAIGVAFILGLSERFFDAIVRAVEKHAETAKAAEEAASKAPASMPAQQPPATTIQVESKDGGPPKPPAPPPSHLPGVRIDLNRGPVQLQEIPGAIVLDQPLKVETDVVLKSSSGVFKVNPEKKTIAAGETRLEFVVVPEKDAKPALVRVTAVVAGSEVSEEVEYR